MTFPAKLALANLNGNNGFKLSGVAADDFAAFVASAGDVNGDGFADVMIGAFGADPHGLNSGAAYVVFGHDGTFPSNIDLANLNSLNGFRISGVAAGDFTGLSVASGDVNGDGFGDLIIGAELASGEVAQSGASYVVFGKATGFAANIDLSTLNGTNGFKLSGVGKFDFSGYSTASADVNGDGFDDLIVGARGATGDASKSGAAYVVFGKAANFDTNINLSSLDGSNGFKLSGVAANDYAGSSVASAGDVNGDGISDVIIGATGADPHGSFSGAAYVVFGHTGDFPDNIDLSSLTGTGSAGFTISGAAESDLAGLSVASAGDFNGDGFGDLIIGAKGADPHGAFSGAAYVVFGQPAFAPNIDLSSLNGSNGFAIFGEAEKNLVGRSASAGDVNGDGFDDLIIGAYGANQYDGASYVVFGHASGFTSTLELSTLAPTFGSKFTGADGEQSGRRVATAGDVNGDGFADLIVGAEYAAPHGDQSGASYVVFGGETPPIPSFPFASSLDVTEVLYVGYFGRAGDPGGVDFWLGALNSGFPASDAAASFSVQIEAKNQYPFLADPSNALQAQITSFIGSVYQDLFNRDPDQGGLNFWQNYLSTHLGDPHSVGTFILAVANGAQNTAPGQDQTTIINKLAAAEFLTQSFANAGISFDLAPSEENKLAHSNIAGVTSDPASLVDRKSVV